MSHCVNDKAVEVSILVLMDSRIKIESEEIEKLIKITVSILVLMDSRIKIQLPL